LEKGLAAGGGGAAGRKPVAFRKPDLSGSARPKRKIIIGRYG
jgi:hypothetical protein